MLNRRSVFAMAWPVILANASTPLLGLADTAILGQSSNSNALAALALAVLIFNFIFWSCGFLRMSTTGFVAQQAGAQQYHSLINTVLSGLMLSLTIAVGLLLFQNAIKFFALQLLQANNLVEQQAQQYFNIRIWGAPATLGLYVLTGLLIGLGKTKALLAMQVGLNSLNIVLDYIFGFVFNMQVEGVALGTVCAEWITFSATILIVMFLNRSILLAHFKQQHHKAIFNRNSLLPLLSNNRDIFIRTLFLLLSFAWFTNAGAKMGTNILAANHILLQFISFSAFFLDGFAFVAEGLIGKYLGAKNLKQLRDAIKITSQCSAVIALLLSASFALLGSYFISQLTQDVNTQQHAISLLPFAAIYISLSFAAFQLDGIFIGATQAQAMRNASVFSFISFIVLHFILTPFNETGLWLSFIGYVIFRAGFLLLYWSRIYCPFTRA